LYKATELLYSIFIISVKYCGLLLTIKATLRVQECINILRTKEATSKNVDFFFLKAGPLFSLFDIKPSDKVTTALLPMSETIGKNLPLLKFNTTEDLEVFIRLALLWSCRFINKTQPKEVEVFMLVLWLIKDLTLYFNIP